MQIIKIIKIKNIMIDKITKSQSILTLSETFTKSKRYSIIHRF